MDDAVSDEEQPVTVPFAAGLGCLIAGIIIVIVVPLVWWVLTGHLPLL